NHGCLAFTPAGDALLVTGLNRSYTPFMELWHFSGPAPGKGGGEAARPAAAEGARAPAGVPRMEEVELPPLKGWGRILAFHPDSRHLAVGHLEKGKYWTSLIDVATSTAKIGTPGWRGKIESYGADGRLCLKWTPQDLRTYDLESENLLRTFRNPNQPAK